jgi:hypothetical protein
MSVTDVARALLVLLPAALLGWFVVRARGGARPTTPQTLVAAAGLVAAGGAFLGIWALSFPDGATASIPSTTRIVDTPTRAGELKEFLEEHDGEVVRLSVECSAFGDDFPRDNACFWVRLDDYSPEAGDVHQLWFDATRGEPWEDLGTGSDSIMQLMVPARPTGSTSLVASNGGDVSSGAGGLRVTGYFAVSITGTGSLGPPGVVVARLAPVLPPAG